jgi:hypothetical protein
MSGEAAALLEQLRGAVGAAVDADGHVNLAPWSFDGGQRGAERLAFRQVEGDRGRHRGSGVIDAHRRGVGGEVLKAENGTTVSCSC